MENVCKDQVEEIVKFELSGEPVEGAMGCAEKVDTPAADHQLPSGGEIIHCKHGARKVIGLGTRRFNAAHNRCKRCMLPEAVVFVCNLWPVSVAVWVLDDRDALRSTRHIVGSPYTSFRETTSRDTVHNICPGFRRCPARILKSRCTSAAR